MSNDKQGNKENLRYPEALKLKRDSDNKMEISNEFIEDENEFEGQVSLFEMDNKPLKSKVNSEIQEVSEREKNSETRITEKVQDDKEPIQIRSSNPLDETKKNMIIVGAKKEHVKKLREDVNKINQSKELSQETDRLKSFIKDYKNNHKFYNETEFEFNLRINEILARLKDNTKENMLFRYLVFVVRLIGMESRENPMAIETSILEDILQPMSMYLVNSEDIKIYEAEKKIVQTTYNFFNSDYLYSPFKTDTAREKRLVVLTPETYEIMEVIPQEPVEIFKSGIQTGSVSKVKEVTLVPYEESTPTVFKLDMEYEESNDTNSITETLEVSCEDMAHYFVQYQLGGPEKAKMEVEELIVAEIASNIIKRITDQITKK